LPQGAFGAATGGNVGPGAEPVVLVEFTEGFVAVDIGRL
jgi:hypothetical protein